VATVDRRSKTSTSEVRLKANAIIPIIIAIIAAIQLALDLAYNFLS
jgi:hypothetical protein